MVLNTISEEKLHQVGSILNNNQESLAKRFRALFTLRNVKNHVAMDYILRTIEQDSSALLKHECCFCLGQMQDPYAVDRLSGVLSNQKEHPMVRHEAGEALGAIGDVKALPVLEQYSSDKCPEVAQTCQLAIKRIKWASANKDAAVKCASEGCYKSVDPTPALEDASVSSMREVLMDRESDLFSKYQAMFGLRNKRTDEAINALGEALVAFKDDEENALLKHEIAYVLGQVQSPLSVGHLTEMLSHRDENEMVRHECAEALGSIATEDALKILDEYKKDECNVVKESIEVALDMLEYERSEQFQFLN